MSATCLLPIPLFFIFCYIIEKKNILLYFNIAWVNDEMTIYVHISWVHECKKMKWLQKFSISTIQPLGKRGPSKIVEKEPFSELSYSLLIQWQLRKLKGNLFCFVYPHHLCDVCIAYTMTGFAMVTTFNVSLTVQQQPRYITITPGILTWSIRI